MSAREDINALLDDANEQIRETLPTLHEESLENENARPRFRARIKSVLEQLRSTLDYLAVELTGRYGTPKGLIYYPLAQGSQDYQTEIDKKMPGVAVARPDIAQVIQKWQPFQPGKEWLRELNQLAREQKHNRLTLQLIRGTFRCRVTERNTGAFVEWFGLTFRPGPHAGSCIIDSQGGPIVLRPEANRSPTSPKPFWVGVGPTGVEVFGMPIDFDTQLPWPTPNLEVERQRMDRWFFTIPHTSVLGFLESCDSQIREVINEIAQIAGL